MLINDYKIKKKMYLNTLERDLLNLFYIYNKLLLKFQKRPCYKYDDEFYCIEKNV